MEIISFSNEPVKQVTEFPLDCLPDIIAQSVQTICKAQSLPVQYVASGCLWAAATLAGRRYYSEFGNRGKNILYILWCGPVSMGKTPSFTATCVDPLSEAYKYAKSKYDEQINQYLESRRSKDKTEHMPHPQHFIPITQEGTTEGLIAKHRFQPHGIGVYYDEAETIFSAGNYKGQNDAISFFTMAFAGGRFQQVRADVEKERVIDQMNINLLMGTQTERLSNIFTPDRLTSGFAARFLTVDAEYQPLNLDIDPFGQTQKMCNEWSQILEYLFMGAINSENPILIEITPEGKEAFRIYNRILMAESNERILGRTESYLIGAEAKLSNYLPRLAQVLAIINNPRQPFIDSLIMNKAYMLYRYFRESSLQSISRLKIEGDTGLPIELDNLYQMLPDEFTSKDAAMVCHRLGLNERRFEVSIRNKDFSALFRKVGRGKYIKT